MTVVNPLSTPNMVVQSTSSAATTATERQVDLRPEQMVRATVLEGGLDRALLEINHRHYRAQSDIALQTGQRLTLQVLQLEPKLEFKIIHDPLGNRLSQLLPLMSQPFDWAGLLGKVRHLPQPGNLPPASEQVYQQLQQLLMPGARLPQTVEQNLDRLPAQLQQLYLAIAGGQVVNDAGVVSAVSGQPYVPGNAESVPIDLPQLVRALQGQLQQIQFSAGRAVPQNWLVETKNLLLPLQQSLARGQTLPPQQNELLVVMAQIRQQSNLPPQFAGELDRLILQLTRQAGREHLLTTRPEVGSHNAGTTNQNQQAPVGQRLPDGQPAPPQNTQALPADTARPAAETFVPGSGRSIYLGTYAPTSGASPPLLQPAPLVPAEISAGLQQLLSQVEQLQAQKGALSPELLGRLEGLLGKLQQLPPAAQSSTQPILPGLEMVMTQLSQLLQQGPQQPQGGSLGFLSQLFGFHLEAELLKGKTREALASLKMSLLALQKDFAEEVKEPLQRLELFQLCKGKLAEEQVQFLPLPFSELEDGYLLMEKQPAEEDDEEQAESLHLALSLRLSALGNMRVDMLYDRQGLHLRLACEDEPRMAYLQEQLPELEEAIEALPLCGVSFASDAGLPVRELIERLLPAAAGVLDERV